MLFAAPCAAEHEPEGRLEAQPPEEGALAAQPEFVPALHPEPVLPPVSQESPRALVQELLEPMPQDAPES